VSTLDLPMEFLDPGSLATFSGAALALTIVVNYLKEPVDQVFLRLRLPRVHTRWVVLAAAGLIVSAFTPWESSLRGVTALMLNAVALAAASIGMWTVARENRILRR